MGIPIMGNAKKLIKTRTFHLKVTELLLTIIAFTLFAGDGDICAFTFKEDARDGTLLSLHCGFIIR